MKVRPGQSHDQQKDGGGGHEDSSGHLQDCVRDHRTRLRDSINFLRRRF